MANASLTWLGHAAFRLDTPEGKRIYVDPWLSNPKCPENEKEPERVDLIALTHGHDDHVGETVDLAKQFSSPVIALVELREWLSGQGLEASRHVTWSIGTITSRKRSVPKSNAFSRSSRWWNENPPRSCDAPRIDRISSSV